MYSDRAAGNSTSQAARLRLLLWVNVALFVAACAIAVAGVLGKQMAPAREVRQASAGGRSDTFTERFEHEFTSEADRDAVLGILREGNPENAGLIFVADKDEKDLVVTVDGVAAAASEYKAFEKTAGGSLFAVAFKNQLTVELGGASVSLDLTGVGRPQRVGVDTSGLGMRLVYLKSGEGYQ